jgi:lipopolysaccharide biosynthesis glycosyltransferase
MERACTIVAENYLAQALVFCNSFRLHNPTIELYVLITDASEDYQSIFVGTTVLGLSDLDIPQDWLNEMKKYYDVVEFATSLKPFLLQTLLKGGVESAVFIDPDTLFFDSIYEAIEISKRTGIALTPHRLTPFPFEKINFNEDVFLKYGIFNLGFIAVGKKGEGMLNWWAERLRWHSTRFPNSVYFTDQKWVDLVPGFFDYGLVRNFGYNLAPWNLDERDLRIKDGRFYVGNDPLIFIHFSQMSGGLAKGIMSNAWGSLLSTFANQEQKLELISKMTDDYSASLVLETSRLQKPNGSKKIKELDPYTREQIRSKLLQRFRGLKSKKVIGRRSILVILILNFLSRSDSFNGLIGGLKSDYQRFLKRYKIFLITLFRRSTS